MLSGSHPRHNQAEGLALSSRVRGRFGQWSDSATVGFEIGLPPSPASCAQVSLIVSGLNMAE